LFTAIAASKPSLCQPIEGALEQRRCEALAAMNPARCPHQLVVQESWGGNVGASFRRSSRAQATPEAPPFVPFLYVVLGTLAVLWWPWLLVWGHDMVGHLRGLGIAGSGMLCGALVLYLLARLVAVEGPINFVEYERVFVPGDEDLGRLGYAGWSLLSRPLFALFGGGYGLLYAVNAFFGVLAILAVTSLARRLSGRGEIAGMAALLLASQSALIRVGASASETLPCAALSIIFFDLLMRWEQLPRRLSAGSAIVLVPILLVIRPEGVLLGVPALAALLFAPEGLRPLWRSWSPTQRGAALWIALLFLGALALFGNLPRPPVTWGLWFSNLEAVLADLFSPWFLSPVMLIGGLLASCWLLVERPSRPFGAAAWTWTLLLLTVWGIQGSEGNLAFGASRYVVIWLPWLAVALAWAIGRVPRGRWHWGVATVCLLASVPQYGLVVERTNLQVEHDFYVRVLPEVPPGSLLVLPSAPSDNQEFTPEAAPLAILAVLRQSARWMTLAEVQKRPGAALDAYLLQGFYGHQVTPSQLDSGCVAKVLHSESVASSPDVGLHADVPVGTEVVLGLYRLKCNPL